MAERIFMLTTSMDSEQQVDELGLILNEQSRKRGDVRFITKSEAIRYTIAFTHKQLTEVLNPEDLRDDG